MSFQDTLADLVKGDNEALLKLIREVYLRGVDDGAEAARSEDFNCIFITGMKLKQHSTRLVLQ